MVSEYLLHRLKHELSLLVFARCIRFVILLDYVVILRWRNSLTELLAGKYLYMVANEFHNFQFENVANETSWTLASICYFVCVIVLVLSLSTRFANN